MIQTIGPGHRNGSVSIPASKSFAHRILICAAMQEYNSSVSCDGLSQDIMATVNCLDALGAKIKIEKTCQGESVLHISPVKRGSGIAGAAKTGEQEPVILPVAESGSTLRFLLPLAGVLGKECIFQMEGRLPSRPLAPYSDVLQSHGMHIGVKEKSLFCSGFLEGGSFELPGNISSQFISGLLMSLPFIQDDSTLSIQGKLESEGYVRITEGVLNRAGIVFCKEDQHYMIPGRQIPQLPSSLSVEGDWSSAAFFLCMGCLSDQGISVSGLSNPSLQGDSELLSILSRFGACITEKENRITVRRGSCFPLEIDAESIPDLIPVLSVLACAAEGDTRIVHASRLRLKESDRLKSTAQLISSLGGSAEELPDGLVIHGTGRLHGGIVDSCNDHRLAMSAAVAACICTVDVTVRGSECVAKSYPDFWEEFSTLTVQ